MSPAVPALPFASLTEHLCSPQSQVGFLQEDAKAMDFTFDSTRQTWEHVEIKTSACAEQICSGRMNQGREGGSVSQLM